MQDAALVRMVHGPSDCDHQARDTFLAHSEVVTRWRRLSVWSGGHCVLVEPLLEAATFDQPHAEVVLAVVFADLVDRHDVGVVQVRGRFGLCLESLDERCRRQHSTDDGLQGHHPVQTDLTRFVHDAHAPAGDLAE